MSNVRPVELYIARDLSGETFGFYLKPEFDAVSGNWNPYDGEFIQIPQELVPEISIGECWACRMEITVGAKMGDD